MKLIAGFLIAAACYGVTTVTIARPVTAKAGVSGSITLVATVTGPAGTILWSHVSGPGTGTFGTATSVSTTFTAPTRSTTSADYVVQAAYTNSDGVTTATAHVGAVLVDANDVVILPTGTATEVAINKLVGPLLRGYASTSMGTYLDIADGALGNTIATAALANPPHLGTALTGTFQVTNAPATLIGTGSSLISELAGGNGVIVAWNDPTDGAAAGRHWDTCNVVNDNLCTLADYNLLITIGSGLTVYKQPAETSTFQRHWWGQEGGAQNASWNYYGIELALYRLFYRTGILSYLTQARQYADYWWTWAIDHGTKGQAPRVVNLQGQYLRALDGHSERFLPLYTYAKYFSDGGAVIQMPHDIRGTGFDAREAGYSLWHVALGAMADSDATRHIGYCASVATLVPLWNTWQHPHGFWGEDPFGYSAPGYPYYPIGNSPWRTDIPIHGLQSSYDVLYDTTATGCNNTALASLTLNSIKAAVSWTYNTGTALTGNKGVYYDAEYGSLGQVNLTASGTYSVLNGGTAVTGVGSSATTQLNCDGTRYIGFVGPNTVYRVMSCTDNTHFVISPAYGYWGEIGNLSAATATAANRAYPCLNASGELCGDGSDGIRDLSRLMPGIAGWTYYHTGEAFYKTAGDSWFINFAGGPADGPGGVLACNGTGCDGVATDFEAALPSCEVAAAPCTHTHNSSADVYTYLGKNYGQGPGNPGVVNYLAYRVMTPSPPPTEYRSVISGGVVIGGRTVIR